MALDNAKNFAKVTVSTGYDASATSIVLSSGHGAKLPTASFNAVWWNATDYADPSDDPNVEIVRVTAISTDTLTVTRAQESTSASTKNTAGKTYKMIAGITAKVINTDIGQTLNTTSTPQFARLGLGAAADASSPLYVAGTIRATSSASAANFLLDVSPDTVLTIANNATATPFSNANNFGGVFWIAGLTGSDQMAQFMVSGGVMKLVSQTNADFSTTAATASKINVYLSSNVVTIENKIGGTLTCRVAAIRLKSSH